MNATKMRHQRGRVRPTVRPADLAAHPESRMQWIRHARGLPNGNTLLLCAHCNRAAPCPTEEYLHGQEGHNWEMCGGPDRCDLFHRARYARERETLS